MAELATLPARFGLSRETLRVRGPDRKTWLDGLLTCSVAAVERGRAGYGLLLSKQGKIVTDTFLLDTGEEMFVGVAMARGAAVRELLDRYLVMEDAELDQPPEPFRWCLGSRRDADPAIASGALSLGSLSTELWIERDEGAPLPDAAELLAAHGLGLYGIDFGDRDNPHEASLDRLAVSWTKGCYLGQEVVCMQDMRGKVKRRLVGLDAEPELLPLLQAGSGPLELMGPDDSAVGQVSSVHAASGKIRLLASISASALESHAPLTLLGKPVRVAVGPAMKLS